jgi:hypothetical protein
MTQLRYVSIKREQTSAWTPLAEEALQRIVTSGGQLHRCADAIEPQKAKSRLTAAFCETRRVQR